MPQNDDKKEEGRPEAPSLTPKQMEDWNNFQTWMKDKGYAGDPRMDKMKFSKSIVDMYRSENPNTSISYDIIGNVQKSIREYRNSAIEEVKSGKRRLTGDPGQNFENFMPWVTKTADDAFLGRFTSQFTFPSQYISNKYARESVQPEMLERQGFAANTPQQQTSPMAVEAKQRVANQASYGQYRRLPNK
jgi:hypothetical protein